MRKLIALLAAAALVAAWWMFQNAGPIVVGGNTLILAPHAMAYLVAAVVFSVLAVTLAVLLVRGAWSRRP